MLLHRISVFQNQRDSRFLYRESFDNHEQFPSEPEKDEKKEQKEYNAEDIHEHIDRIRTQEEQEKQKESTLNEDDVFDGLYKKIEQKESHQLFEYISQGRIEDLSQHLEAIFQTRETTLDIHQYDALCQSLQQRYALDFQKVRDVVPMGKEKAIRLVLEVSDESIEKGYREESLVVYEGSEKAIREILESNAKTYREGSERGEDMLYEGEDDRYFIV